MVIGDGHEDVNQLDVDLEGSLGLLLTRWRIFWSLTRTILAWSILTRLRLRWFSPGLSLTRVWLRTRRRVWRLLGPEGAPRNQQAHREQTRGEFSHRVLKLYL